MPSPSIQTAKQLEIAVAGFMQREPAFFVRTVGGQSFDLLLQAINNARLFAERMIDFEYSKVSVDIPGVDILNGGNLGNAVLHGTTTPVFVKKIRTPFLPSAINGGSQFPVDLRSKRKWNDRIKARFEGARPVDTTNFAFITDAPFVLVQDGNTIFVAPPDTTAFATNPFTVFADAIQWLPPYITGTETDFLLQYAFDWLQYRSIQELNYYLKEDERVTLSERQVSTAWDAIIKWNNELVLNNVDDVDLD